MECKICGKMGEETELFDGIFEEKIEAVCGSCARVENVPLIKKPVFEEENNSHLTVRERMEKMANPKKPLPKEHFIAHKNLAKLRFPSKREDHPDLIENYDWILKTARRRKKISQTQLAEELIIPLQVITDLESAKIAKDFMDYVERLENFLGIKIRKRVPETFNFQRKPENKDEEEIVLERARENMQFNIKEREISESEELDIVDKEKMKKWTLKDLINLKRKKKENELLKAEKSELVGDELELEE
jgi:ribosome-binding protein aMBF1 (putative translation factor)